MAFGLIYIFLMYLDRIFTIYTCERHVPHQATSDRSVCADMIIPAVDSDYVKLQTPSLSDNQ